MILRFKREALLYDIGNYAYIAGHRLEIEEHATEVAHLLMDICAEGNIDRVSRVLASVYAFVKAKIEVGDGYEAIDDELWTPEEYVIELDDRCGLAATKCQLLSCMIHEFMVCRVIADWLSITYEQYAKVWTEKADALLAEIEATIRHAAPFRRRIEPL